MHWFRTDAPIRQKMLIVFQTMIGFMVAIQASSFLGWVGQAISVALILTAIYLAHQFRNAVCDPYVTTVVRMEGLAAGDLNSPILFNDYKDCVGRLSRGMVGFRDAAVAQRRSGEEQAEVVRILGESFSRLTQGDLTADVTADVPPAYAELKDNFNEALASLRTLIGSVSESAMAIRTGSGEIAQASEDLARRTEANAASLEQTSAAITQMDGRLKATAEAATRTVHRADDAIATVDGGRAIADEAVQAMARVADGAKGIDSVIEGLDKIAFQTRVLAMNAAVEAGRAGEAGRGFAVVADLVSALAMRSEEEAARARDQLTATQTDIVSAVEMVQKVDGALANISGDVAEVHSLLGQMAADNRAQSSAIGEISVAIGTMDQATQQNAAMVEQTSAAARNLTSEVVTLADQTGKFEVGHSRPAPLLLATIGAASCEEELCLAGEAPARRARDAG
ncbi:methyl-accepting chemotaxis protein [Sphingomonas xinjiangensis]|uniref:Methyl-accepting chemotaxis protein n=1 Tax=Sphingomonas xinjiangensis TaxID=643568 RepID=A0A840YFH8_9SPHN|nr:methyl-accepting chemotaxis protein [Sphingomonas xinjiangensis]MBB5710729.1 methyl-accepting chemotaxis protein [Sphingomonas xinjiangensis]